MSALKCKTIFSQIHLFATQVKCRQERKSDNVLWLSEGIHNSALYWSMKTNGSVKYKPAGCCWYIGFNPRKTFWWCQQDWVIASETHDDDDDYDGVGDSHGHGHGQGHGNDADDYDDCVSEMMVNVLCLTMKHRFHSKPYTLAICFQH